ncbi:LysR family transcriptional regulator [Martelella mediterranea]|uniref:LysR family transcriptional regulator n=1 Tax=Martelella mediterranea TaxID=293089 RepID=UPI001E641CFF|nr:LysR family transcriptional regulator [Martelella mediterranea]MCD1633632.1 LysR family transcriptional regulator [Martelella mediterranea]
MDDRRLLLFDLNLIKVFIAVYEAENLTVAAQRLGLTQPAVSHALRRLRDTFDDRLFLRAGHEMHPTPAATALYAPFQQSMRILRDSLDSTLTFDPATSTRQFRLAMTDTGEFVTLPRLLNALQAVAPGVNIQTARVATDALETALRVGKVDAAIGYCPLLEDTACRGTFLLKDQLICLVRNGHPVLEKDWTRDSFSELSFIDVSREATGYRMARTRIEDLGIQYHIAARLEHFTILPEIVRRTDYAAIFPRSVFSLMHHHDDLKLCELPFAMPDYEIKFWTHEMFSADPGLQWLNGVLQHVFEPQKEGFHANQS